MADLQVKIGADVTELNKGIKSAEASLQGFNNQVKRGVPQTTQAFTNLSRVVSDAPFGFIAIQNNLEPLLQSFQQLKTQTGSTGGAIKALASGLAGAGGLFFAFSAVSSIITALIQKYGSLGAAFTELSASQDRAAVAQRAVNKEFVSAISAQTGEINTLQNLISILKDSNASQTKRTNAYKELKQEFPGVIQNLTEENALTAEGGRLITQRATQLVAYIKLKAKESALIKLGEEATKKQLETAKQGIDVLQNQSTFLNKLVNSALGGGNIGLGLAIRLNQTGKSFESAGKDADLYAEALRGVQDEIAGFDRNIVDPDKVIKTPKAKVEVGKLTYVPKDIEIVGLDKKTIDDAVNEQFRIDSGAGVNVPLNLTIPQAAFDALKKFGENEYWKKIQENTQGIINQFDQFLAPVINTAFEALGNGTNIIKAIGQSLKALVVQIGITIARAAILSAILNSIFPGGAAIGGKTVQGFGAIFKSILGFGNTASPNFGGVTGGGVAVNVGGSFNIRGTDLVAVVQQSNQRIGRTG